jgi:hypothetical protein
VVDEACAIATATAVDDPSIGKGDELFIDYGLTVDGQIADEIRASYACHSGAAACRLPSVDARRPVTSRLNFLDPTPDGGPSETFLCPRR